ncbi:helix-turn-helix domain-containing protein [Enterocloster citroniae]
MKVTNKDMSSINRVSNKVHQNKKTLSYTASMFGTRLVELRNERKLSQQQSADLIGISRNTLSMYERGERTASIDIAVNAANAYNVTLDYLFGTGYKSKKINDTGLYDLGFSEESLEQLMNEKVVYYVDAVLSNPLFDKIRDLLYGYYYKPLVNSYEINYISRMIADLLYSIMVWAMKDSYKLRPMTQKEIEDLLDAVKQCLINIGRNDLGISSDYDEFLDNTDTIESQLERIKSMLEYSSDYTIIQAKEEGFREAIRMIKAGILSLSDTRLTEDTEYINTILDHTHKLEKYLRKIPLTDSIKMSVKEQFVLAEKMMNDEKEHGQ